MSNIKVTGNENVKKNCFSRISSSKVDRFTSNQKMISGQFYTYGLIHFTSGNVHTCNICLSLCCSGRLAGRVPICIKSLSCAPNVDVISIPTTLNNLEGYLRNFKLFVTRYLVKCPEAYEPEA